MTSVSLGDLARTFMLRRHNAELKVKSQNLSTEVVTGLTSDVRKRLSGDFGTLGGIDRSLALLEGRKSVTSEASVLAAAMQTALEAIDTAAVDISGDLLNYGTSGSSMTLAQIGANAREEFTSAISRLNTRIGDRSVFAGTATQQSAVADAETILTALDGAIAGSTSAVDIETAISDWFDSPAGYEAVGYTGGSALADIKVSDVESVHLDVTANDSAIRETLKGLAMAAMIDRATPAAAQAALASIAGQRLVGNQVDRTELAATLGVQQAKIESASSSNANEIAALQIARKDLLGVDDYETATNLEAVQTQIETLYTLTSRLSRMSLVDYL